MTTAIGVILLALAIAERIIIAHREMLLWVNIITTFTAIFVMFGYLPVYFSHLRYTVSSTEICGHSGVFFRKNRAIKLSSVQHYTVITSPFSGGMGLNFLVLSVYGGKFILNFIAVSDLEEILEITGLEKWWEGKRV